MLSSFFSYTASPTTDIYTLSLHDALPISFVAVTSCEVRMRRGPPSSTVWTLVTAFSAAARDINSGRDIKSRTNAADWRRMPRCSRVDVGKPRGLAPAVGGLVPRAIRPTPTPAPAATAAAAATATTIFLLISVCTPHQVVPGIVRADAACRGRGRRAGELSEP